VLITTTERNITITSTTNKSSAVADMPPECLYERIRQRVPQNCEANVYPTFDALNKEDPLKLSSSNLVRENKKAGLQSGEGRLMIN